MSSHIEKEQDSNVRLNTNITKNERQSSSQGFSSASVAQQAANSSSYVTQLQAMQQMANSSPYVTQLHAMQQKANNSPAVQQGAQQQAMADKHTSSQHPIQKKENNTGLPDNLKSGIENLSGYAMDDVKVHRNSDKPAQMQAHAYAQGTDIHLAPGQEKHLPHEAWHVVQQKQGRVKPTMQMKGKVNINDDAGLEKEADVMGSKAIQLNDNVNKNRTVANTSFQNKSKTVQRKIDIEQVNKIIDKYNKREGNNSILGLINSIDDLNEAIKHLPPDLKEKIEIANNDFDETGKRTFFRDRSGNEVKASDDTDPTNLDVNDATQRPKQIMNALNVGGAHASDPHFKIFDLLTERIENNLGANTLVQFWKGAHIVFNDQGEVYDLLKEDGAPIAAKKADGVMKTKTEFVGKTSANFGGIPIIGSDPMEQRRGSMMERRPGPFQETSHYPNTEGGKPQYGIDLPEALGGHLLFGLTPNNETFVQTEGAGFQNFNQGFIQHIKGFLTVKGFAKMPVPSLKFTPGSGVPYLQTNWVGSPKGTQTGIAGYSKHSEAEGVEIRELENMDFNEWLASLNFE